MNPRDTEALTESERRRSAALMRVNHSGEVCAQALYLGQALVARDEQLAKKLCQAAAEEEAHLSWCKERLKTLKDRPSLLNPLWAVGSFGMGVIAGLMGDTASLGFLAETEHQVTRHLENHLNKLPPSDLTSKAILEKMKADEIKHADTALLNGGVLPPKPVRKLMALFAKVMTTTAQYY